ncbi:MAG TPA: iron-containing redox enzyme family protein [Actinomycetota bacterium]|nr:iron-containing redox enzyme family protein [Actinomycetota bacterium]
MVPESSQQIGILDRSRPARPVSARLRRKIDLVTSGFAEACARVFLHPRIRELWPEYLVTQHAIIRTTVPLMEAGRDRARALAAADPVAAGVEEYLDRHIVEETNHDEWLLNDLEAIGVSRDRALARVPSPTVAALTGSQYYWVLHYHPVGLLGYFAFMEGFPPQPELIEGLKERTGYPEEAFRTFRLHGELDPGHKEELDRTIDALPLTSEHEDVLGLSAMSTGVLVTCSLEEVAGAIAGS